MDPKSSAQQIDVLHLLINYFGKPKIVLPSFQFINKPENRDEIVWLMYKTIGKAALNRFILINLKKQKNLVVKFTEITVEHWIMLLNNKLGIGALIWIRNCCLSILEDIIEIGYRTYTIEEIKTIKSMFVHYGGNDKNFQDECDDSDVDENGYYKVVGCDCGALNNACLNE